MKTQRSVKLFQVALSAMFFLTSFFLIGGPAKAAEQKVIKWRLQSYVASPTIEVYKITSVRFAERVKAMSQGRLLITPFCAGEIVKASEILDAVSKGVLEAGIGVGSYWEGKIRAAKIEYGLPQSFVNKTEMDTYFQERGFMEILRKAYSQYGTHYVGIAIDNGFALLSSKPVRNLDDLKAMKLRATGAGADLLKELGAAMVPVAGPELYTALATKVIDGCVYGGFEAQWKLGNHEVTKYIMWPKIMPVHGPNNFFVNAKAWNSLPDDLKSIVEVAWTKAAEEFYIFKYNADIEYLEKMKAHGLEVVTLSESDQKKMADAALVVWDKASSESEYSAQAVKLMKDYLKFLGRM